MYSEPGPGVFSGSLAKPGLGSRCLHTCIWLMGCLQMRALFRRPGAPQTGFVLCRKKDDFASSIIFQNSNLWLV